MGEYSKSSPQSIQAMFGSIADRYDQTNAVLSFNLHRRWNRQLVESVKGEFLADLCCGTGEIGFNFLKAQKSPCTAYFIDFCEEMLLHARSKGRRTDFLSHRLSYIQADVQEIPLGEESVDCATMAYGIRNVKNPLQCLREVHRILRPGSAFGILELTRPSNFFLKASHRFYLSVILPMIGKLMTSNQEAYRYLCSSIKGFIDPQELKRMLLESGFVDVEVKPLCGGIATILLAKKR